MSGGFPPATRRMIIERANYRCELCGAYAEGGSIHHRRARGMGGSKNSVTNSAVNGLLLCGSGTTGCHGAVESDPVDSLARGLKVLRGHDPTTVPVTLLIGRVLLTADGGYDYDLEGATS